MVMVLRRGAEAMFAHSESAMPKRNDNHADHLPPLITAEDAG
jgi:hypothetical protein